MDKYACRISVKTRTCFHGFTFVFLRIHVRVFRGTFLLGLVGGSRISVLVGICDWRHPEKVFKTIREILV